MEVGQIVTPKPSRSSLALICFVWYVTRNRIEYAIFSDVVKFIFAACPSHNYLYMTSENYWFQTLLLPLQVFLQFSALLFSNKTITQWLICSEQGTFNLRQHNYSLSTFVSLGIWKLRTLFQPIYCMYLLASSMYNINKMFLSF